MTSQHPMRRYLGGLILATLVLLVSSLAISWLEDKTAASREILAGLSLIPVAALLSMFWVHWRYLRGLDEYLRHLHAKALVVGTALTLGTGTAWGYLERALDAPALPVFWLNPLFWIAYAAAVVLFSHRDNAGAP